MIDLIHVSISIYQNDGLDETSFMTNMFIQRTPKKSRVPKKSKLSPSSKSSYSVDILTCPSSTTTTNHDLSSLLNSCVICQKDSIEQERQKSSAQEILQPKNVRYVECMSCHYKFCSTCVFGIYDYIVRSIAKTVHQQDSSYNAISKMRSLLIEDKEYCISCGPCCMFRNTIPFGTKSSVTRPPRPPDWTGNQVNPKREYDSNFTFQNKVDAQNSWRRVKNRLKVDECSLDFLHQYHDDFIDDKKPLLPMKRSYKVLHHINRHRKTTVRVRQERNSFTILFKDV